MSRPVGTERLQALEAVGHRRDDEAVPFEGELRRLADDVVVLDEQDMGVLCHPVL